MKCPKCGKESDGSFCPNCGTQLKGQNTNTSVENTTTQQGYKMVQSSEQKKKKGGCLKPILIAFAVFIILGILMSILGDDSDESSSTKSSEAGAETESATDETSEIDDPEDDFITVGSSFEVDNLKITVNEANANFTDYDDPYEMYAPEDGMKYVMVSFTFENIGDSGDEYVSIYDFDCFADNTSCEQEYALDDSSFINTNLSPGRNVSFKTYYIVPQDANSIELEYKESMWNDDRVLIKIQ